MPVEISAGIGGLRCAYPGLQIVPLNSLKEGKNSAVYSANFSKSRQSAQSAEKGWEKQPGVFRWQAGQGCRKDPGSLLKQTADRQRTIKKVGKSYWEATFPRASGNGRVAP